MESGEWSIRVQAAMHHRSIKSLDHSPFLRGKLLVGVGEHVYLCGRQHMKPTRATFRACDTGVFFLQSAAAARSWPVEQVRLEELRESFRETNG